LLREYLFLDIETTGTSVIDSVILQVGAIHIPTGSIFDVTILPTKEEFARANPVALDVTGITWDFLLGNGVSCQQAKDDFTRFLFHLPPDYTVVGQNIQFDLRFLQQFWASELDWVGFPFGRFEDIIPLFKTLKKLDRSIRSPNNKSASISQALGLPREPDMHRALEGAKAAMRNYLSITERLDVIMGAKR
jgi:DNA polymerase III epsilon subunit-like protein